MRLHIDVSSAENLSETMVREGLAAAKRASGRENEYPISIHISLHIFAPHSPPLLISLPINRIQYAYSMQHSETQFFLLSSWIIYYPSRVARGADYLCTRPSPPTPREAGSGSDPRQSVTCITDLDLRINLSLRKIIENWVHPIKLFVILTISALKLRKTLYQLSVWTIFPYPLTLCWPLIS